MILPFRKTWVLMSFITFGETYFGIDFGCVLASILFPFWYSFGINVSVSGCSFLKWFVDCFCNLLFLRFYDPQWSPSIGHVGSGACGRPEQITFRRRHRSKDVYSSIRHSFCIDLAIISKPFPLGVRWYFTIQMINVYTLARWRNRGMPR